MGQALHFGPRRPMLEDPPAADIVPRCTICCNGPQSDIGFWSPLQANDTGCRIAGKRKRENSRPRKSCGQISVTSEAPSILQSPMSERYHHEMLLEPFHTEMQVRK